jgi:2'-5' RNA ligase
MALQNYSLWFMPTGRADEEFSALLSRLAAQYSSPKFPPHITLIGLVEAEEAAMISKTQAVAAQLHPFLIKLTQVGYTSDFYRSLFVNVESSEKILTAYQEARKIFPANQAASLMPHLSLLYGDFPITTKQQIIKEIGDTYPHTFESSTLYLYLTDGDASTWRKIHEFPL